MFRILEEREDSYLIEDEKGNISHQNRTKYFELKYIKFNGQRITHDFGGGLKVEETYDDAIFNAHIGEKTIQISDGEKIAEAVLANDPSIYSDLFNEWYNIAVKTEIIKTLFRMYPHRINMKAMPGCYIVDDIFMVDDHGKAHVMNNGRWDFLCIVASGNNNGQRITLPGIGDMEITSVTMVIIAKIMFLLNPNSKDMVFMNQLPQDVAEHVRKLDKKRLEHLR